MNELGNIGFTYDIKTFTPDGEKKDDFSVHNLITDEGLRWVVARIFAKETLAPSFTENMKYGDLIDFWLSFMTKSHTPNGKFDSFPTFIPEIGESELINVIKNVNTAYNSDGSEYIFSENKRARFKLKSINTNTNTLTFNQYDANDNFYFKCVNSPIILTGLFLLVGDEGWWNHYSNQTYGATTKAYSLLLSEAMFPEPILLEVGGKLQVNCGCTVISA